jgi:outer membrane protein assembly factor BamB
MVEANFSKSMKTISMCVLMCLTAGVAKADWLQFRGPNAAAVSTEAKIPAEELKIAWTADLPGRGLSAPIVVGERVFVTCSSGPGQETLHVFCFNTADGSKRWERAMRATGRTMSHNKTCVAANTPCSDGDRVFALFSSNDLFAFDLDGNLLWLRGLTFDYPNASNSLGMAQSPVVIDGTLVVQSENDSESFAAGLDVATGQNKWKLERPKAANWSSATLWKGAVALQSSKGILAVEPNTGKTVWNYSDGASTTPSSASERASGGNEPGRVPPISAWCARTATYATRCPSMKTGATVVTSGRCEPPNAGWFVTAMSPSTSGSACATRRVQMPSAPRWTGKCGAF